MEPTDTTILVLDDDEGMTEVLSLYLEMAGYDVRFGNSIEDARARIAERPPALVVTDTLDGPEAIPELRRLVGPTTPILLMSGAIRTQFDELPINAFLPKPLDVETLDKTIRRLLEPTSPADPELRKLLRRVDELPERPVAIDAFWDGDTVNDWFVVLTAILPRASYTHARYSESDLATYTWGEAEALIDDGPPSYPQGVLVDRLGRRIARRLGVPFHFDSPTETCLDPTRWWDTQPTPSPTPWAVEWEIEHWTRDGERHRDVGRNTETAASAREAHERVRDRLMRTHADPGRMSELGVVRVKIETAVLGLPEGPVSVVSELSMGGG